MEHIKCNAMSMQVRKANDRGRYTLRYVFDVISRTDSPQVLMLETWGGHNKGYAALHGDLSSARNHITRRLTKIAQGNKGICEGRSGDIDIVITDRSEFYLTEDGGDTNRIKTIMNASVRGLEAALLTCAETGFMNSFDAKFEEWSEQASFENMRGLHTHLSMDGLFIMAALRMAHEAKDGKIFDSLNHVLDFVTASSIYENGTGPTVCHSLLERAIELTNPNLGVHESVKPDFIVNNDPIPEPEKPKTEIYKSWGAYA